MAIYDNECIFIECLEVDNLIGGGSSNQIGTPTAPRAFDPLVGILTTDKTADAVWKLESKLLLLFPDPPPNLSTFTLTLTEPTYSARRSIVGSAIVNNNVQNNATGQPETANIGPFYNGDSGILSVSGNVSGNVTLTSIDDSGTYGSLVIISDSDTTIPAGFYKSLVAKISPVISFNASNTISYSYQMLHSETGNTPELIFYQDDAIMPTVSNQEILGITGTPTNVSGVPSLNTTNTIQVTMQVSNAIRKHYNVSWVARVSGADIISSTQLPTGINQAEGSNPVFNFNAQPAANVYTENVVIVCSGQSSNGMQSSANATHPTLNLRIDTLSIARNESSIRVSSGIGDFPAVGYNMAFNSSTLLTTNQEMQLLGGLFRYPPSVNYALSLPTGPDYSNITTTPAHTHRWATFNYGSHSFAIAEFTINGGIGLSAVIETWKLYFRVEGSTNWLDLNAPYPGVGSPVANGDPCLVLASSTITKKVATIGPNFYTGTVLLRVGLPIGSNIRFNNISAIFY